jgi:hypothetical protein
MISDHTAPYLSTATPQQDSFLRLNEMQVYASDLSRLNCAIGKSQGFAMIRSRRSDYFRRKMESPLAVIPPIETPRHPHQQPRNEGAPDGTPVTRVIRGFFRLSSNFNTSVIVP